MSIKSGRVRCEMPPFSSASCLHSPSQSHLDSFLPQDSTQSPYHSQCSPAVSQLSSITNSLVTTPFTPFLKPLFSCHTHRNPKKKPVTPFTCSVPLHQAVAFSNHRLGQLLNSSCNTRSTSIVALGLQPTTIFKNAILLVEYPSPWCHGRSDEALK